MTGALTGPQKAAIAVLSLDEDLAGQVLAQLDDDALRTLHKAVEQLESVPDEALLSVIDELERALSAPVSVAGPVARTYMRRLTGRAVGEARAEKLFAPVEDKAPLGASELLATARVDALAELLQDEHPQIAAVILTQLPARTAARVLKELPQALAGDLLARLSSLDEVPDHAVTEASDGVVRALAAAGGLAGSDARHDFDGLAFSAALVNELPQTDGDRLLERVADHDDAAAKRIREAMFTFEDLMRIDQRQLAVLLREAPSETLVVALSSADDDLREHFFGALSKRAADTLRDDLAALPPRRVAEVEAAQREIIETAQRLASEGTITMPERGGDE